MEESVSFTLGLIGFLAFWSGLLKIAEAAGITQGLARALHPFLRRLFPRLPHDSPAIGAITLSLAANLLGLSHAATPLGIKAMHELEKVNPSPGEVSDEMASLANLRQDLLSLHHHCRAFELVPPDHRW